MEKNFSNKPKWIIIAVLLLLLLVIVAVIIWAIFFRTPDIPLPPDYPPQETDGNQQPIPNDQGGKLESPTGGGAVNVTYESVVTVDLSDKTVTLSYANPSMSNQNVAIAIVIDDLTVARSALITPGNMIKSLTLEDKAAKKLSVGGYDAEIIIYCYHPETGEKAMVDTRGEVTVYVTE